MPGFPPPPAGLPPAAQDLLEQGASFQAAVRLPTLPVFNGASAGIGGKVPTLPFSVCGFKLPGPFAFGLSFSLPAFAIPLPAFAVALGITCDGILNGHPLNFAADVAWGGNRISLADPDPDAESEG